MLQKHKNCVILTKCVLLPEFHSHNTIFCHNNKTALAVKKFHFYKSDKLGVRYEMNTLYVVIIMCCIQCIQQ